MGELSVADFKHRTLIQIRFKDIDTLGHVNNANHITYLELARIHYFKEVIGEIDWSANGLILASININYKKIIHLEDVVFVHTRCNVIGNKSFNLEYIIADNHSTIFATASSVLVSYSYKEDKTIEIPAEWKDKLTKYDGIA